MKSAPPFDDALLLVSYYPPSRFHGGGLRLLDLYRVIRALAPERRIDLVACQPGDSGVDRELVDLFDEVHLLSAPAEEFRAGSAKMELLAARGYGVVDLQYLQSGALAPIFRKHSGRLIFSPMESMARFAAFDFLTALRSMRGRDWKAFFQSAGHAIREVLYARNADRVSCVSEPDAVFLRRLMPWRTVDAIDTGVSFSEFPLALGNSAWERAFSEAPRVAFVAFFGSETNQKALEWYLAQVHPVVSAAVPDYCLEVIGKGLDLDRCYPSGVAPIGEVDSIEQALQGAWVGIAPALAGAGMRGKISQYAIMGIPCVASSIAATGFAYVDEESIFVAADAPAFAERCIRLLKDPPLNLAAGNAARQVCRRSYSWNSRRRKIAETYFRDASIKMDGFGASDE